MGDVDPKLLRAELRDALQVLEPGKLSGIVKIPSGYAILKVSQHAGTMGTHVVNQRERRPLGLREA
jgi:parvulin-like peptidyl-prolyl isomerase